MFFDLILSDAPKLSIPKSTEAGDAIVPRRVVIPAALSPHGVSTNSPSDHGSNACQEASKGEDGNRLMHISEPIVERATAPSVIVGKAAEDYPSLSAGERMSSLELIAKQVSQCISSESGAEGHEDDS